MELRYDGLGEPDGKTKLLDAALTVIRTKGYSAATVDESAAQRA